MRRVRIAELKAQLSRHLRAVEAGDEIEVTDRNRPIARIVPVGKTRSVSFVEAAVRPRALRGRRARPAGWGVDSLELLLRDRRSR
jgi:prevent-host-death family protein